MVSDVGIRVSSEAKRATEHHLNRLSSGVTGTLRALANL